MNREEVLTKIEALLRQHKEGSLGSIHQEPYKGALFNLFAAAFNGGFINSPGQSDYLSADALTDVLNSRTPELLEQQAWQDLRGFWSEWTYAWRHAHLLKR